MQRPGRQWVHHASRALRGVQRALDGALAVLAPPLCCLCARNAKPARVDLCPHCALSLPRLAPAPARAPAPPSSPGFDQIDGRPLLAPFHYAHPVDYMIRALKFHGERVNARVLGALLAEARAAIPAPLPQLVVPLPLHRLRFLARGYDQAAELALRVTQHLHLPLARHALQRVKHTAEQSHLGAAARRANVAAVFVAPRPLTGLRVALLDDVLTTGSTALAAARALDAAGARDIEIWVVARAMKFARGRQTSGTVPAASGDRAAADEPVRKPLTRASGHAR